MNVGIIKIRKLTLCLMGAMVFSFIFLSVPWESIKVGVDGIGFFDRNNYISNIGSGGRLDYFDYSTFLSKISGEYLWALITNFWVVDLNYSAESFLLFVSFVCIFSFSFFLIKKSHWVSLILLFNPLIVDFVVSQSRLALAFSILILSGYFYKKKKLGAAVLACLAAIIHTASFIFIFIFIAINFFLSIYKRNKISNEFLFLLLFVVGFLVSIMVGPARDFILSYFGDRRAIYHDMSSSLLYSSFWMLLLVPLFIEKYKNIYDEVYCFSIVICSIVFWNYFFSSYSTRFISVGIPFIIYSIFSFSSVNKIIVAGAFILYSLMQWLYWLQII